MKLYIMRGRVPAVVDWNKIRRLLDESSDVSARDSLDNLL